MTWDNLDRTARREKYMAYIDKQLIKHGHVNKDDPEQRLRLSDEEIKKLVDKLFAKFVYQKK
jgi:hypothetical protein